MIFLDYSFCKSFCFVLCDLDQSFLGFAQPFICLQLQSNHLLLSLGANKVIGVTTLRAGEGGERDDGMAVMEGALDRTDDDRRHTRSEQQ
jgi:hypothetical protein